jgi:hypothetical protein
MALGDWEDGIDGGTPLSAERLNERDAAIEAAQATADAAAAGDHTHTAADITADTVGGGTATDVQGILEELEARIAAVEGA